MGRHTYRRDVFSTRMTNLYRKRPDASGMSNLKTDGNESKKLWESEAGIALLPPTFFRHFYDFGFWLRGTDVAVQLV